MVVVVAPVAALVVALVPRNAARERVVAVALVD